MTKPNPVAPKTDTPAMRIPEDLIAMYERLQKFRLGGLACILTSMESIELVERVASLESTLAAERASRVQAQIRCERINFTYEVPKRFRDNRNGTAYSSGYEAGWRDWCGDNPYAYSQQRYFDAYEAGWSAAQSGVRKKTARTLSKPSVSPEQEKP